MLGDIALILLGAGLALAALKAIKSFWSFRAQSTSDYATSASTGSLRDVLSGKFEAHGLIYDHTGRVKSRFIAEIDGAFDAEGGTLLEHFSYQSGAKDQRRWTIAFDPDGRRFTATAPDVIGDGHGEHVGDAVRMTYRLKLPKRTGGHVLNVVDWLYVMPDGAIANRSEMRKFGIKVAELVAVFRPVEAAAAATAPETGKEIAAE